MNSFFDIFKHAAQFQTKFQELQASLENLTVEESSGGGMVKVVMNGNQKIVSLMIEQKLLEDQREQKDSNMLEALLISAINSAYIQSKYLLEQKMEEMMKNGSMGISSFLK